MVPKWRNEWRRSGGGGRAREEGASPDARCLWYPECLDLHTGSRPALSARTVCRNASALPLRHPGSPLILRFGTLRGYSRIAEEPLGAGGVCASVPQESVSQAESTSERALSGAAVVPYSCGRPGRLAGGPGLRNTGRSQAALLPAEAFPPVMRS